MYRVLIVDDHAGFRRCARELLVSEGFAVVGEAGDGEEAARMAAALRANLVDGRNSSPHWTASPSPNGCWPWTVTCRSCSS